MNKHQQQRHIASGRRTDYPYLYPYGGDDDEDFDEERDYGYC